MKQNILPPSQTIQDGLTNAGNNIENNIVSCLTGFKDKLLSDLVEASNVLKSGLEPIGDGLKTAFTEMLQSQQQQSSIMVYLPIIGGIAVGSLILFKKK